jgi:peptide deformylase
MFEIEKIGNPVLREPSKEVSLEDVSLKQFVEEMKETLHIVKGLGLASNQVGILKRVFIYDVGDGPEVMINPEVVWESDEKVEDIEGCLSVPGIEVTIERAEKIRVEGFTLKGKKKTIEAEGLLARVMQHEIDHLNGTLIIDRATDEQRREAMKKMLEGE